MATVTYKAPKGDERVVDYMGVEFYHDQPMELDGDEHAHLLLKASKNPHFEVEGFEAPASQEPKRRGRPPKVQADVESGTD